MITWGAVLRETWKEGAMRSVARIILLVELTGGGLHSDLNKLSISR